MSLTRMQKQASIARRKAIEKLVARTTALNKESGHPIHPGPGATVAARRMYTHEKNKWRAKMRREGKSPLSHPDVAKRLAAARNGNGTAPHAENGEQPSNPTYVRRAKQQKSAATRVLKDGTSADADFAEALTALDTLVSTLRKLPPERARQVTKMLVTFTGD